MLSSDDVLRIHRLNRLIDELTRKRDKVLERATYFELVKIAAMTGSTNFVIAACRKFRDGCRSPVNQSSCRVSTAHTIAKNAINNVR